MWFRDLFALLARLGLSYIFVAEGLAKIQNYAATVDYMQGYGVPGRLLPLVIATELGAGLLVAGGLFTQWAAFALAGFCGLTALLFHADGSFDQLIQFQKNIAIAGGFLALVAFGAGGWSLDAIRRGRIAAAAAAEGGVV